MTIKETFRKLGSPFNATIDVDGESYDYFSGTAYFGIPQDQDFLELYVKGLQLFGINNGTSRTNNVQLGIYDEAEHHAAVKWGAEASLITSSGFLAAQIAVKNLAALGKVRTAPNTHPALWLSENPATRGTFSEWKEDIVTEINHSEHREWVLISNSMNNLRPERYDFSFVQRIASDKNIVLIIDDSHGIGINYNGKSALAATPRLKNVEIVLVASMAKALGVDAGIILGSKFLIEKLKNTHEFAGASPPAAAGLYAFLNADKIYENALAKLKEHILLLGTALSGKEGWEFIPDFPVFFSKNADLSNRLLAQRILVSSFPYPDQHGENVNRIVLSSWHSIKAIQKLITSLS